MKAIPINFETSFNQFYIVDKNSYEISSTKNEDFWSKKNYSNRLVARKGILGVLTECYGNVKGEIIFLKDANDSFDLEKFDHIVEGSIILESGFFQILDSPNNAVEFEMKLEPGFYRLRVYFSNLSSVVDDDGDNFYKIEIWRDSIKDVKVLKQYKNYRY